jgi:hypothetical protein
MGAGPPGDKTTSQAKSGGQGPLKEKMASLVGPGTSPSSGGWEQKLGFAAPSISRSRHLAF